jgi:hypothetical protein
VLGRTSAHSPWSGLAQWPRKRGRPSWRGAPGVLTHDSVARTGSLADKVWRERRRKHRGSQGRAPDKEAAAVRCGGDGLMVAFEAMEVLRWSAAVG